MQYQCLKRFVLSKAWLILLAAWLCSIGFGLAALTQYDATPGPISKAPAIWPKQVTLRHSEKLPTILVFLHPYCPCSRATLYNLSHLATSVQGKAVIYISFLTPGNAANGWERTDIWRQAKNISGTTVLSDKNGELAKQFHSLTSGQVLVYGQDGKKWFDGGLTDSRGHAGDNSGSMAIESLVKQASGQTAVLKTLIFGCPIFNPQDGKAK